MKENFLDRAKADGKVLVRTVSLLAQLSKAKLEISNKRKERQHLLTAVGSTVFKIYERSNNFEGNELLEAASNQFDNLRRLDEELLNLETEVQQVKGGFKTKPGHGDSEKTIPDD